MDKKKLKLSTGWRGSKGKGLLWIGARGGWGGQSLASSFIWSFLPSRWQSGSCPSVVYLPLAFSTSQVSDVMLPCARCDLRSHFLIQVGRLKALRCTHARETHGHISLKSEFTCPFWLKICSKKLLSSVYWQFTLDSCKTRLQLKKIKKQKVSQIKPPKPCCKNSWDGFTLWTGRVTSCNLWLPGNIRKVTGLKEVMKPTDK